MGLFDKKYCDICGDKIGLLGNRKLADGNMCKKCAAKLSPWFSDRRQSSLAEIKEQLAYREENRNAVAAFRTTRSLGTETRVLLDEDARKFMVTRGGKLAEENPDVLDFSQVTGCDVEIEEDRDEVLRETADGKSESYNPPRYTYSYDFYITIRVNHPYFDTIRFQLNSTSVQANGGQPVYGTMTLDPSLDAKYREYDQMAREIKEVLTGARQQVRDEAAQAAKPKTAVICPCCGATTIPDANGRCEYCGGAVN